MKSNPVLVHWNGFLTAPVASIDSRQRGLRVRSDERGRTRIENTLNGRVRSRDEEERSRDDHDYNEDSSVAECEKGSIVDERAAVMFSVICFPPLRRTPLLS